MAEPQVGAHYTLTGKWEENKKFNTYDFKFSSFESKLDEKHGLKEYLSREAPNCGGTVAAALVKMFGGDVIKKAASGVAALATVPGMTYEQRLRFHEWAKTEQSVCQTKEKLYSIGLLPALVNRLLRELGRNAEEKIKADCFALTAIDGVGFKTVAAIADLLGIPKDDPGRIKAGILHSMKVLYDDGHTCVVRNDLIREACALLSLNHVLVDAQIDVLLAEFKLCSDETKLDDVLKQE